MSEVRGQRSDVGGKPTNKCQRQAGITLIALIITVIILLILAGTAISISINGGDLFGRSQNAVAQYNSRVAEEENKINEVWSILKNASGPEPITIPEELAPGDTVTWTPSGTYEWNKDVYSSDDTGTIGGPSGNYTIATKQLYSGTAPSGVTVSDTWEGGSNVNVTINRWKVLKVENGKVTLVPESPTLGLPLKGATGYNNSVKLLNEACSALYGGNLPGVEARSINMEDIEGLMMETPAVTAAKAATESQPAYNTAWSSTDTYQERYRNVWGVYPESYNKYPAIYGLEANRNIDGTSTTSGLGLSDEGNKFYTRAESIVSTATNIQPVRTYYFLSSDDFKVALGDIYKDLIALDNKFYWVASRCVALTYGCDFCVRRVGNGLDCHGISSFADGIGSIAFGLFPVITISSGTFSGADHVYTFTPAS